MASFPNYVNEIHHESSRNYDPKPIFQEKPDFRTNANDMLSKIRPRHKDDQTCTKIAAKIVNILDKTSRKIRTTLKPYENLFLFGRLTSDMIDRRCMSNSARKYNDTHTSQKGNGFHARLFIIYIHHSCM